MGFRKVCVTGVKVTFSFENRSLVKTFSVKPWMYSPFEFKCKLILSFFSTQKVSTSSFVMYNVFYLKNFGLLHKKWLLKTPQSLNSLIVERQLNSNNTVLYNDWNITLVSFPYKCYKLFILL